MTTILKQMGIQQWRFRPVGLDSMLGAESVSLAKQSLLHQSSEHENTPDHQAYADGEIQHKLDGHARILSDNYQPMPATLSVDSRNTFRNYSTFCILP